MPSDWTVTRAGVGSRRRGLPGGPARLVPPAVTPLRATDLAAGLAGQVRGGARDAFRSRVADYLGAAATATYTTYRRALAACFLELASRREGSELLVPAFASYDFPHAAEGVGLDVRRYDVDPETLAADLDSLRACDAGDALALVAVNVLGYGSPVDELRAFCRERDLFLVETLGYALGATYAGERLGTFGDCAVLNFQQGKPVPVGGGMVAARSPELSFGDAGRAQVAPNAGTLAGYALLSHPRWYAVYDRATDLLDGVDLADRATTHPGSSTAGYEPPFRTMSDFQGAVASQTFDRLADHRRRRASTARFYAAALADCAGVDHVRGVEGLGDHPHVRYPLLVDPPDLRDAVRAALREAGVQATTLYDWPAVDADRFPGAARLQGTILTLPTHPYVTDQDRQAVVEVVQQVTDRYRA